MTRHDSVSRRKALKLAGAAAATATIAGCSSDDGGNGDENGDENGGGNGGENNADAWADVSEFSLIGQTGGWEGDSPDPISGATNPTLYLTEGEEYTVEWENGDGIEHNFVIEDGDGNDIEESDYEAEQGATVTMSFEATAEMAEYYCTPHPDQMRGSIEIQ